MRNDRFQAQVRGERSMSQGFIAQYAAEAALRTSGVASLEESEVAQLKATLGVEHAGQGVEVVFAQDNDRHVAISVYPLIYYGEVLPEVAWQIQENVRRDVEQYTDLQVTAVDVHVKNVVQRPEEEA